MSARTVVRWTCFAGFIGVIYLANWLVARYGIVSVGFGLYAPAGVFAAGIAFSLRDGLRESSSMLWVYAAIAIGAVASYLWASPELAVASGLAFLFSEVADALVYEPLRGRNLTTALVASNLVGAVVDSAIFLWLAFNSLEFLKGQVVGKLWMTLPFIPLAFFGRKRIAALS